MTIEDINSVVELKKVIEAQKIKIAENNTRQKASINRLIAIQLRYTEQLFDAVDKLIITSEVSVRNVKHVPTTSIKWELKKMRTISLNQLKAAQSNIK